MLEVTLIGLQVIRVVLVLAALLVTEAIMIYPRSRGGFWVLLGGAVLDLALLLALFLFSPRGYTVGPSGSVTIVRPGPKVVIPAEAIASIDYDPSNSVFKGAIRSAASIRKCVEGGDLCEGKVKCKVQDAYSMRSTPQVIGAAHDALAYARSQVEIEMNGVGDNPIFFPEENLQLSGANFQGSPVSVPMDMAGMVVTMVSVMSERRMNRLNNPALSVGLPAFLTKGAGMFSGMMLSQYTADMQIVEQRILSAPASIQSIPAAADQEDFVSMGMNTALKNFQILDNAYGILGIEFMAAAQTLDFREYQFGAGVNKAKEVIRKHVAFLDVDRPLYPDHNAMKALVRSCEILDEVEKTVGSLE